MSMVEWEMVHGRRAFPVAQALFTGEPVDVPRILGCGWHDTSVSEAGAFAVVRDGAGQDDLVGEVVRVSYGDAQVFVFVLTAADVPVDFSLTRRAFLGLALLSAESIEVEIVPVDPVMA